MIFFVIIFNLVFIRAILKLPAKLGKKVGTPVAIIAILVLIYANYLRRNVNIGFGNALLTVLLGIMIVIHIVWKK